MEITYKKLSAIDLDVFIHKRVTQLTESSKQGVQKIMEVKIRRII